MHYAVLEMPLVLTQSESTESGHEYADVAGVSYEYPAMYRNLIRPGELFVYYRGRRRKDGGKYEQAYLGTGIVGRTSTSVESSRLTCAIEDYSHFGKPVPFKADGRHVEPLGKVPAKRAGLYFKKGVRAICDETYARILTFAAAYDPTVRSSAESSLVLIVEGIAVDLATRWLEARYPTGQIRTMPAMTPVYEFRIDLPDQRSEYVSVRATTGAQPRIAITEGERLFSLNSGGAHKLLIFYQIDVPTRTALARFFETGLSTADWLLRPTQWEGTLVHPNSESTVKA